jgi:hypothetical protein
VTGLSARQGEQSSELGNGASRYWELSGHAISLVTHGKSLDRKLAAVIRGRYWSAGLPRKATVGNLIAADVETVPDLAERQRQRLRVLANDRPGSLSHLVFQSP